MNMSTKNTLGGYALFVISAALTCASGPRDARAADTEAFAPQGLSDTRPNVLFLIDSTESLGTPLGGETSTTPDFDPSLTYASFIPVNQACATDTAYFDTSPSAALPDCTRNNIGAVPVSNLVCDANSKSSLASNGSLENKKYVTKKVTGSGRNATTTWPGLTMTYKPADGSVYCDTATEPPASAFTNLQPIRMWYGNYLNYETALRLKVTLPGSSSSATRMTVLKDALEAIASEYKGKINIGMMRTSTTGAKQSGGAGKGGMVVFPIRPMDRPAMYAPQYHSGTTTLDDFIWTMRKRAACKNDQNCDTWDPLPKADNCAPGANCIGVMHPNGSAKPLAEMLYEAYLYYSGQDVQYGSRSAVDPTIDFDSVRESIANPDASTGSQYYEKPASTNCQNNYIIMLTDGLSQQDSSSNTDISKLVESLPEDVLKAGGYTVNKNGSVTYPVNSWSANAKAPSEYIDDLAFYLRWARPSYAPKLPATGVTTYTVGFNLSSLSAQDAKDATQLLNDIAKQGGTEAAVLAESASSLRGLLDGIVTKILATSTSFSAPSVTINAFNRTQNLNDLYMAVFRPEYLRRWKGNVKKYNVVSDPVTLTSRIVDASGSTAVDDTTGNFLPLSQSLWSAGPDGAFAPEGGAASQIPHPSVRNVLVDNDDDKLESLRSYVGGLDTTAKRAVFDLGNTATDAAVNDLTNNLVDWLYGVDLYDESPVGPDPDRDGLFNDGNLDTTETKNLMGDPLHSRPAVVVYGRENDDKDAVVYITTNEGLLHAINARDLDDTAGNGGRELWAFAPRELLDRLDFLRNRSDKIELKDRTDQRLYGIDGTVRVLRIDRDRDGPIEKSKGDRVFLFFGLRRGGSAYYGLDVTDPANPELMWRTELPDGAQSWSNPTIGDWVRVNIKGATYGTRGTAPVEGEPWDPSVGFNNAAPENRFVVVIGGGFDSSNDSMVYAPDSKGNKIYMLDATSGSILWSGGPTASGATEEFTNMNHSIVADVRVVDLSGDLFADRMYAADLGGQVWRFDITNGNSAADLVEGGVMASVGGAANASKDRRFYYAPDVSEVRCGGRVFYNVAIGSGDRENPVSDTSTRNTFFSFRDYLTRTPVAKQNYKADCSSTTGTPCFETIVDNSELVDVTTTAAPTVGPDAAGWKMDLVAVGSSGGTPTITGRGEKALAESRTFANNVYFTTYAPELRNQGDCGNEVGINRLYVVNACNAAPVNNYDGEVGAASVADRSLQLAQGSIAPEVVFIFPTPPPGCTTRDCMPLPQCLIGLETCGNGLPNRPVRVFWRERGAE